MIEYGDIKKHSSKKTLKIEKKAKREMKERSKRSR